MLNTGSCEHSAGDFSIKMGTSFFCEILDHLHFQTSNNAPEFLVEVVSVSSGVAHAQVSDNYNVFSCTDNTSEV